MAVKVPQIGPATPEEADLEGLNPFRDSIMHQCPHMYFRRMQQETPLFDVEGTDVHIVTRHELIVPLVRDTETFSNRFGSAGEPPKGEVLEKMKAVLATGWPQTPAVPHAFSKHCRFFFHTTKNC